MNIRTRFAPSPTGFLHVGGLRTALYAYLLAKQNNGQFILRIEDTDQKRFVEGGIENIIRSLKWAGVDIDEGVELNDKNEVVEVGSKGPYIQSKRLSIYAKYADQLLKNEQAYYCFCSSERLEDLRNYQQKNKLPTGYDGFCRNLDKEEISKKISENSAKVVRMKMPKEGVTTFFDLVRGEVTFKNELIDDQVIIKSDGFPTYHFAVVVDDHEMEISYIIRGDEWLNSTPKHIQLYKYFGWEVPQLAHLPLLLNPDKSKLSKRQGDVAVEDYSKKGYLPQAMVNFVAMLGWNPGVEQEMYSMADLIKEFKLERINKSGAVFNLEKLDWFNQQYLKSISDSELVQLSKPYLQAEGLLNGNETEAWLAKAINLEKERVSTLLDLSSALRFVFSLPEYDGRILVWKKSNKDELDNVMPKLRDLLNTISAHDYLKDSLQIKVGEWIKENNLQNGVVLWPLRVALSGQEHSPGPFEIAEVLGKEEVLKRLDIAIAKK